MNIKLLCKAKKILFILLICLLANFSNVFSQNISLKELIYLQKENFLNIDNFLIKNSWKKNPENLNMWLFGKSLNTDSSEAIFLLKNKNCKQNIIFYKFSDPFNYKILIDSASNVSKKHYNIKAYNIEFEDITLEYYYVKCYKYSDSEKNSKFGIWFYSKEDIEYFKVIDNYFSMNYGLKYKMALIENEICLFDNIIEFQNANISPERFTVIENVPEFLGGENEYIKFLWKNSLYPSKARDLGIQGTVLISFNVDIDGSLSDFRIEKGIGGGCDEEVLRIFKMMPKWTIPVHKGKVEKVRLTKPFRFTLN